ncbi:MAG: hypothetical protein ABI432_17645 [Flavobacteriales bacterium]
MRTLILTSLLALPFAIRAQNVAINATGAAPAASAILDVTSATTGVLIPRMGLSATNVAAPVVAPATSLLVYNTATAGVAPTNVTPGYYYWGGAAWVRISGSTDAWQTTGNAGTTPAANFIGTTDAQDWVIKTGGSAAGNERMRFLSGGKVVVNNTGVGAFANDVFSVYADGTTNGTTTNTSVLGTRAINGYTSTGFGVAGFTSGTAATTFGLYGGATAVTGTANGIRGEAASINGLAIVGIANTSAGAIPAATNARGVLGQVNGTLLGTGQAIGVQGLINNTVATGDARGVQGSTNSNAGVGVIGFANTLLNTAFSFGTIGQSNAAFSAAVMGNSISNYNGPLYNPLGVVGITNSPVGFGMDGYNSTATGTGILGEGNALVGTYLVAGSGGAFSGTTNGLYSNATAAANGTGVIGVGNSAALGTLATGSGGAFTGSATGVYARANAPAAGTGVIGLGNNIAAPTTLATGSGGAFNGTSAGAFALATSAGTGTGMIGVGNNLGFATLPGGSGGAFTGATAGSYSLATTVASGTGVVGAGNNVAVATLANGSGGAFTGSSVGSFSKATSLTGTGSLGVGNNAGPPYTVLATGSGIAGHGVLFGVYGIAESNLDGVAGTPARAGGYFESGTGATNTFTYVAAYEGTGVPRKVMGNGTVNTVVKNDADEYVLLSAPEAPENLFQDYGSGQLVNGHAHITLDPTLARNILVNAEHPLRVFIQLRGDCGGVYVTNESGSGFDVVELQGGTSSTPFNWTVVANRANQTLSDGTVWKFAEERFAHTLGPQLHLQSAGVDLQPEHPATVVLETASPERAQISMTPEERAKILAPRSVQDEPAKPQP